jgi:hypothetical protein
MHFFQSQSVNELKKCLANKKLGNNTKYQHIFSGLQTLLLVLAFAVVALAHPHWGPGSRYPGNYERGRGRFPGAYYPGGRSGVPIVIIVEERPAPAASTTAAPTVAANATTPAAAPTPAVPAA